MMAEQTMLIQMMITMIAGKKMAGTIPRRFYFYNPDIQKALNLYNIYPSFLNAVLMHNVVEKGI